MSLHSYEYYARMLCFAPSVFTSLSAHLTSLLLPTSLFAVTIHLHVPIVTLHIVPKPFIFSPHRPLSHLSFVPLRAARQTTS